MNRESANEVTAGAARWQRQARSHAPSTARRRLALVVDDDPDTRETLAIFLRWAGHDVRTAADGAAALRMAQTFHPDLIFLDIAMPGLDGYELCRQLRTLRDFEHAHIFALSGLHGADHDERCVAAGFSAQLTKPLDLTLLGNLR